VELLIHTSTSETYGTAQYVPIDEKHPLVGQSPYSATKIAADKLAESYHLSFDLPVVTIRPFNTFGPRQSARAIIPTIAVQALSGTDAIRLGALDPVRDLSYVKDTVEGFVLAAQTPRAVGNVINLGRGEGISIRELAQLILEICGSQAKIETQAGRLRPENSEVHTLIADSRKAEQLLGWTPGYGFRRALEETISWFADNLDRYKPDIYNV
jgi:nucleoside-diphosphate-sugar epimerase